MAHKETDLSVVALRFLAFSGETKKQSSLGSAQPYLSIF
jgi:hypothetical protein